MTVPGTIEAGTARDEGPNVYRNLSGYRQEVGDVHVRIYPLQPPGERVEETGPGEVTPGTANETTHPKCALDIFKVNENEVNDFWR